MTRAFLSPRLGQASPWSVGTEVLTAFFTIRSLVDCAMPDTGQGENKCSVRGSIKSC